MGKASRTKRERKQVQVEAEREHLTAQQAEKKDFIYYAKMGVRYWGYLWAVLGPTLAYTFSHQPNLKMTILPPPPTPQNPLSMPFRMSNDSSFDLYKVHVSCSVLVKDQHGIKWKSSIGDPTKDIALVGAGEPSTVACAASSFVPAGPLTGDVYMHVIFEYSPLHLCYTRHFMWQLYTENGTTFFLPQSVKQMKFPNKPDYITDVGGNGCQA